MQLRSEERPTTRYGKSLAERELIGHEYLIVKSERVRPVETALMRLRT
jgi:hypothetical protein